MPVTSLHGDCTTYFAPYERPADVIVAAVNAAKHSVRMADYGYTLAALNDAILAAQKRGVDVYLLLDHTQAHGRAEESQLAALDAAGVRWVEGTSAQHHAIMHQKTLIVDAELVIGFAQK